MPPTCSLFAELLCEKYKTYINNIQLNNTNSILSIAIGIQLSHQKNSSSVSVQ